MGRDEGLEQRMGWELGGTEARGWGGSDYTGPRPW